MTSSGSSFSDLPDDRMLTINELCNRFEAACSEGKRPKIEDYLDGLSSLERDIAIREMVPIEIEYMLGNGYGTAVQEYVTRFPELDSQWLTGLLEHSSVADVVNREKHDPSGDHPVQLGEYDISCPIGSGGMGVVYRAVHRRMRRTVALKVLQKELASSDDLRKRFEREVRAAARLIHPNIVTAFDAGEDDGRLYLITEFVEGMDLSQRVKKFGPMDMRSAVHCVVSAAKGLQYAHEQQVIHRDIKPANLLLDTAGTVKILDMGLARLEMDSSGSDAYSELTQSGTFMGTAPFMAPEQARSTRLADARSDIYSLGCVLYYLLAGRAMYSGETVVDTILAHATEPIPQLSTATPPGQVPVELNQAFKRMVAKNPDERFQSMAEVLEALRPLIGGADVVANLASPVVLDETKPQGEGGTVAPTIGFSEINQRAENVPTRDHSSGSTQVTREITSSDVHRHAHRLLTGGAVIGSILLLFLFFFPEGDPPRLTPASDVDEPNNYALKCDGSTYAFFDSLIHDPQDRLTFEVRFRLRSYDTCNLVSWFSSHWTSVYVAQGHIGLGRYENGESILLETQQQIELGRWVHFAGTWDGRRARVFVDGKPMEPKRNGFVLQPVEGQGLYIGGCDPARLPIEHRYRFSYADIDTVRISSGVRYTNEFDASLPMQDDNQTIALFQFSEGSGSTTTDQSGRYRGAITSPNWTSAP